MFGLKKIWPSKKKLVDFLPEVRGRYDTDVLMSKYTWFGVGGPADVMFHPEDEEDLGYFLKMMPYNLPVCVIGGGSNLLVRDGGITGVVIRLDTKYFRQIKISGNEITCFAGVRNADLKKVMLEHELGGLEFLCSIPGVIGGSVKTNAGCFGRCVKDVIARATIVNGRGEKETVTVDDLMLSYRNSLFPDDWIITSITFRMAKDKKENIARILEEQKQYRMANQPYNEKTAGSTFKNPEGLHAWKLIDNANIRSLRVGGAVISDKHANFLVNQNQATAKDIESLGELIRQKVWENSGVELEWEVKRIGVENETK